MKQTLGPFLLLVVVWLIDQTRLLIIICPFKKNKNNVTQVMEQLSFTTTNVPHDTHHSHSIIDNVTTTMTRQGARMINQHPPPHPFQFTNDWRLPMDDPLFSRTEWDMSPIVVPSLKLIFFTQAKVACTVWNQLFRRIQGLVDWQAENCCNLLPWNPQANGLTYLYHYNQMMASPMLQDDTWVKAIFIRDPLERFVSAWLDKAVRHPSFLHDHCCKRYQLDDNQCIESKNSISSFLNLIRICDNTHWRPQSQRLPHPSYWQFISFVGHMESVEKDAKRLLHLVGAWDDFGASGWGETADQAIFQGQTGRRHATMARQRLKQYMSVELERQLRREVYVNDYAHPRIIIGETGIQ